MLMCCRKREGSPLPWANRLRPAESRELGAGTEGEIVWPLLSARAHPQLLEEIRPESLAWVKRSPVDLRVGCVHLPRQLRDGAFGVLGRRGHQIVIELEVPPRLRQRWLCTRGGSHERGKGQQGHLHHPSF